MGESYVYILVDPRSSQPFYVGKGVGRRCYSHVSEARYTNKNSKKLAKIRKIERLGLDVIVTKLVTGVADCTASMLERLLISHLRSTGADLTNQTDGGDGSAGYKHSKEAIRKISASQQGKIVSAATRAKLSDHVKHNNPMYRDDVVAKTSGIYHWAYGKTAKNKGATWTDEQRRAQSERFSRENHPFYGKPCSDERRRAIIQATTGVKKSTTENMKKPKRKEACPHCGILASGGNLKRWHLDKCKEYKPCC